MLFFRNQTIIIGGIGAILISFVLTGIVYWVDISSQTTAEEVWSGKITSVQYIEEWDEWIPPETHTYTDSKGNSHTETTPGYWKHHDAENSIITSDEGEMSVDCAPNGQEFNDSYPNTDAELEKYYPIGQPTSSVHTYENKVQASYSIYRHKDIDLNNYKGLSEYPRDVQNYINVNRLIGNVPNYNNALAKLNEINTYLNKSVPDTANKGKMKSYKEVNIIFVNLGNKPINYAYALQDYWKGGNKNDFVITFSLDKNNNIKWVYPFSWADSQKSELLKIQVREYLSSKKNITDFVPIVTDISKMVEQNFERKQFTDFAYLNVEMSTGAYIILVFLNIVLFVGGIILYIGNPELR
jgi:hypothetical protein